MTPPEGVYLPRPRSGTGWFFATLILIAAAAAWIWSERREKPPGQPRVIGVVEADSTGVVVTPDTGIVLGPSGSIQTPGQPAPVTPDVFIAAAPSFQSPSAGPIGNFFDYARQMQFDPSRGQDLQLPTDEFGRESMVHLEPLTNLRRLDSLAFAQGRILARIRSDAQVADLGLRSGDNFLWVRGTLGTSLPGELWPTSALATPRQITLSFTSRPPSDIPAGKDAWWVGDASTGRQLWIVCGRGWCHN